MTVKELKEILETITDEEATIVTYDAEFDILVDVNTVEHIAEDGKVLIH